MAIPTFDHFLRPILLLATKQDVTRHIAREAMCDEFQLSAEERNLKLPSGSATYVANRTGWAMTFLTKGGLIERVARKTYRATEAGQRFLAEHSNGFTAKDLERIPGWKQAWDTSHKHKNSEPSEDHGYENPKESIEAALVNQHDVVRSKLLEEILKQEPEFFERLVLDVLVKMGYGGSRQEAAMHLGRSGDEGIDGRINEDPLGLDQIMVQAKRYKPENIIDRKTIQAFIGSLAGQGVSKGIFITTSSYSETAQEFVQRGANTKIVLIDGKRLIDLMMQHRVGVRVERSFELLDIDQNYFDEED